LPVVLGACPHDCADKCSIVSFVEGGRLTQVTGNPAHPVTRGFVCGKLARAPEFVYAPDRLTRPLLRTGDKGEGRFQSIAWEDAITIIVERWRRILAEHGPYAILPYFGSGTEGLVHGHLAGRRFFNRLGTLQLERTICTKAGRLGYQYTMGTSQGADPTAIADVKLVVAWGVNAAATNIHHNVFVSAARRRGARTAVVNPIKVRGAEAADVILQPRPGSDAALALGMMNVIVAEGLYDADFVENFTVGFEPLRARLADYPPERVAHFTDVPAETLRAFARLYAELKPSFIYVGPGGLRHSNAGMTMRTLACLPALVGAWRHPGGGLYFPTSTVFPVDWTALEGEAMRRTPARRYNMIGLGHRLAKAEPPVKSLYVFNGNPVATLYNQALVRRGLAREDLFTVVHEQRLTDTARYADIVLPATTQFEQWDLLYSYYAPGLILNEPAIAPVDECRSNLDTFNRLARALGFREPCFRQSDRDVIADILALDHPALAGISLQRLRADGWAEAAVAPMHARFGREPLPTPSGKIELYSERMAADGFEPLPVYMPPRESPEGSPQRFARYPLFFLTPSAHSILNSNYAGEPGWVVADKRPTLLLHPADAEARGIKDGDKVRVFNDRGAVVLWARLTGDVRAGVVASTGQWWSRHYLDGGNANFTTPDFTADMGGGSAFNTNLVEVARAAAAEGGDG
jgi:anaerobic selenocysteine-containing dehydrogenase